jgi:uncharacterized membrane protein YhhN
MSPRTLWILYGFAAILYLALMHSGLPLALTVPLKLIPVALLISLAWHSPGAPRFLFVALLFSAGGDALLALPLENGFVLGLASFLLAQLAYAAGFLSQRQLPPSPGALVRLLLILAYGTGLGMVLIPATGSLQWPVSAYLLAIMAMTCAAAVHRSHALILFLGAAVFVASDSMIAIDRFLAPFDGARYAIMATYYAAQGLLTWGVLAASRNSGPGDHQGIG